MAKKFNMANKPQQHIPTLGDIARPSSSINKEILLASDPVVLGEMFDLSFNARVGILSKDPNELERLNKIAEILLESIPKEKLPYINFIIIDNKLDLRNEVLAPPSQLKHELTEEQRRELRMNALLQLINIVRKGCIYYAHSKNPSWNHNELRNELEKMKDHIVRVGTNEATESKNKKAASPLLFSKKKGENKDGEIDEPPSEQPSEKEHNKLVVTAPRARAESIPNELVQTTEAPPPKPTYSFLDLLAEDGFDTNDLEHFEEQVILKLDKLKEHILHQFNPVFNELNGIRKKLRLLTEQTAKNNQKSIMK